MNATSSDVERAAIRAALRAIIEGNDGVLNPRQVIDVARDPQHILHSQFEWDNETAGDQYRMAQVGALIRRVRLDIVRLARDTRELELTTTRAFQSRPSMRHRAGGYETIDRILADDNKRAELLAQVLRELSSYRKRYAELSELQSVWLAVDEIAADLSADISPSAPGGDARPGAAV